MEVYFFDGLARRDGRYYKVDEQRTIECFGLTPDEMGDQSTVIDDSDWRYLNPVEVKIDDGPDETLHYKCTVM